MQYFGLKYLYYSADLYDADIDEDTGNIESETFRETVRLSIDTGDGTSLAIDSPQPLVVGTVMRNVLDRSGTLIYPNPATAAGGYMYRIYYEEPILSPFGTREGFTSRAERIG